VAAVLRDEEFVVPRGETEIRVGDEVVFVGPQEDIQTAHRLFKGTKEVS
jgi:Trk K+ transport system NAD-binding subunit